MDCRSPSLSNDFICTVAVYEAVVLVCDGWDLAGIVRVVHWIELTQSDVILRRTTLFQPMSPPSGPCNAP